jgi:hypothetical protein
LIKVVVLVVAGAEIGSGVPVRWNSGWGVEAAEGRKGI